MLQTLSIQEYCKTGGWWVGWVKENERYRLPVTEGVSQGNKRHSRENVVNDTVMALHRDRW